jgi:hypothetical protein
LKLYNHTSLNKAADQRQTLRREVEMFKGTSNLLVVQTNANLSNRRMGFLNKTQNAKRSNDAVQRSLTKLIEDERDGKRTKHG